MNIYQVPVLFNEPGDTKDSVARYLIKATGEQQAKNKAEKAFRKDFPKWEQYTVCKPRLEAKEKTVFVDKDGNRYPSQQ